MTARRRAELTVAAAAPETVAAAVAPDDTDAVTTEAVPAEGTVRLRVDRPTTGGLAATVDDAVVNLGVAAAVVELARASGASADDASTDGGASADDASTDGGASTDDASTDERSGRGRRGHDGGTARRDAPKRRHTDDTHDT